MQTKLKNSLYRTVYVRVQNLPFFSAVEYTTTDGRKVVHNYEPNGMSDPQAISDNQSFLAYIAKLFTNAKVNPNNFNNMFLAKYGQYYIDINPRRLNVVQSGEWSPADLPPYLALLEVNGNNITFSITPNALLSDGSNGANNNSITLMSDTRADLVGNSNVKGYVYADSLEFVRQVTDIVTRGLERAAKLVEAYEAVPIVNETDDDTTTTTPNLTNDSQVKFNAAYTEVESQNSHQITTTKGSQTTTTKRANGVSAKAQADIVRNLPNIFKDCIDQIGALLIDPRTVQDMVDYGLSYGDYVDNGGI